MKSEQMLAVAMEYQRLTGHHPSVGLIEQGEGDFNAHAEFSKDDWQKVFGIDQTLLKAAFDKTHLSNINQMLANRIFVEGMRAKGYI